jgi:hypothetical protein
MRGCRFYLSGKGVDPKNGAYKQPVRFCNLPDFTLFNEQLSHVVVSQHDVCLHGDVLHVYGLVLELVPALVLV